MNLSTELKNFIREHITGDTDKLLLSASRFPDIDMPFAVNQILARRQIREKLPSWFSNEDLIFPSRLSAEQCSSESTAQYKQQLFRGNTFCDLTGGLGVDTFYFAQKAQQATYIERYPEYCEAAQQNFRTLQAHHIRILNANAYQAITSIYADTIYIDPARRADSDRRIFALTDCEPDILQLKPLLFEHAKRIIIKISPMADLGETLRLLPETQEIHIIAVKNECKELLFILEANNSLEKKEIPLIYAVNLQSHCEMSPFVFTLSQEKNALSYTTATLGEYLYEPHAALLKSGAFKLIAQRYQVAKLHRHSHLYTSNGIQESFPGRIFRIEETFPFSGKLLRSLKDSFPKANLTTRNFPLSVAELRKRSGIKEGGDIYLFATTLTGENRILIAARKA